MGPQVLSLILGRHKSVSLLLFSHIVPCSPIIDRTDLTCFHRQPILADEVQTFKALITIHKVLQEGHPIVVREAQSHVNWIDSLMRGVAGEGIRGTRNVQVHFAVLVTTPLVIISHFSKVG